MIPTTPLVPRASCPQLRPGVPDLCFFVFQPIRSSDRSTRAAFVAGQLVTPQRTPSIGWHWLAMFYAISNHAKCQRLGFFARIFLVRPVNKHTRQI